MRPRGRLLAAFRVPGRGTWLTTEDGAGAKPAVYTVAAGGFGASADAFARDADMDELWFLSMVGPQTSLKAVWAALLKQPPDPASIYAGGGRALISHGVRLCRIPESTIGTWATKIKRLPVSGGWHALVYTRLAEFAHERDDFLLLIPWGAEEETATMHYRFLNARTAIPLHHSWADWLWRRGIDTLETRRLESVGLTAYRCIPSMSELREDVSAAVAAGTLRVTPRGVDAPMGVAV